MLRFLFIVGLKLWYRIKPIMRGRNALSLATEADIVYNGLDAFG